jgi:hypothetical protein
MRLRSPRVLALATVVSSASLCVAANAGDSPPAGPIVSFQMFLHDSAEASVLDIRGKPQARSGFFRGTIQLSPKLCAGTYRFGFVFTRASGRISELPYKVDIDDARQGGNPARCPFATLPRRHLASLRVYVTVNGEALLRFDARPRDRAGRTFGLLRIPTLHYYLSTGPSGAVTIDTRARYRGGQARRVLLKGQAALAPPG